MKFIDEATIYVRSGKGGDGCVSFLREKFRPKGGPDGGDGGQGAHVIFEATHNASTLLDFRFNKHYKAENGEPGRGRQQYGAAGQDTVLRVPVGTVIVDADSGEFLADLKEAGQRAIICRGGRGGRGNMHFATSVNQTPRDAEPGAPWEERNVTLSLKLLADVGLVGFPNAGKSTLISRISKKKPKIADYPFTTLTPNLGVVRAGQRSFVVADVPGLIEGASQGAGLGHRFLKHLERVSVLVFLVTVDYGEERSPVSDFEILVSELDRYSPQLAAKPKVLVLSKADLPDVESHREAVAGVAKEHGLPMFVASAVTGEGIKPLVNHLGSLVHSASAS